METLQYVQNLAVLADSVADMTDYIRNREGRTAIEVGFSDIQEGRTLEGNGVLATELKRHAKERRFYEPTVVVGAFALQPSILV